jgi:hypothetical protein
LMKFIANFLLEHTLYAYHEPVHQFDGVAVLVS